MFFTNGIWPVSCYLRWGDKKDGFIEGSSSFRVSVYTLRVYVYCSMSIHTLIFVNGNIKSACRWKTDAFSVLPQTHRVQFEFSFNIDILYILCKDGTSMQKLSLLVKIQSDIHICITMCPKKLWNNDIINRYLINHINKCKKSPKPSLVTSNM